MSQITKPKLTEKEQETYDSIHEQYAVPPRWHGREDVLGGGLDQEINVLLRNLSRSFYDDSQILGMSDEEMDKRRWMCQERTQYIRRFIADLLPC